MYIICWFFEDYFLEVFVIYKFFWGCIVLFIILLIIIIVYRKWWKDGWYLWLGIKVRCDSRSCIIWKG